MGYCLPGRDKAASGVQLFEARRDSDTQVKPRGIRVDLLDIEATLLEQCEGVFSDAVVSVRKEAQIVVAHVELGTSRRLEDTLSFLKRPVAGLPLPPYLQPAVDVVIDKLLLSVHSKERQGCRPLISTPAKATVSPSGRSLDEPRRAPRPGLGGCTSA